MEKVKEQTKHNAHHVWHKWHLVHEIIAGYGLWEFMQHVWENHTELLETLRKLMELIR